MIFFSLQECLQKQIYCKYSESAFAKLFKLSPLIFSAFFVSCYKWCKKKGLDCYIKEVNIRKEV